MEAPPIAKEGRHREPRVGLVYDERMLRHATPDGEDHPECRERIEAIWQELESAGVTQRCKVFGAEKVEESQVLGVHARKHVRLIKKVSSKEFNSRRKKIAAGFNSIYLNEGSSESAFLAAGGVVTLTEKVAAGEIDSGVAIVRPPGHHAEHDEAMGFCLFNNIAVAANFLLNYRTDLGVKRILIVDWDVHHGNGTQKMFWDDPRVLFFSVHRFENGGFYPSGDDGSHTMIGEGPGSGFNINVPWEHGLCGDADYLAVWDHILIPIAESYNPDIILISGGFDAALGDPLGGCCVTPDGYAIMMKKLMNFAQGKIMMALEGGYNLKSLSNSVLACVNTLLGQPSNFEKIDGQPFESTWRVIRKVRHALSRFWPVFTENLPETLIVGREPPKVFEDVSTGSDSDLDLVKEDSSTLTEASGPPEGASSPEIIDISALSLSTLSISKETEEISSIDSAPDMWRSQLSKIDIWYGSYGSNMWKPRFLCYIQGGQVEFMKKPCSGCKDKSLPKETSWRVVPHQLFFGRSFSKTWGEGGVAFLDPERNETAKTYMCMYKITLEQFNDVLRQENLIQEEKGPPLFDTLALKSVIEKKSIHLKAVNEGWYCNVLYLGNENGLPILTMTCMPEDIEEFKANRLPLGLPSEAYKNTLLKGLLEGKQLSEEDAEDYITNATLWITDIP